jgi:hypothetical protein
MKGQVENMEHTAVVLETAQAEQLLAKFKAGLKLYMDIGDALSHVLKPLEVGAELFSIESLPALRAGEIRFGLKPCDGLVKLVAALRALDGDRSVGV